MDNTFADTAIIDDTIADDTIAASRAASHIMHEMLNEVSTIMSISQLALLNYREMSIELKSEMKRIVQTAKNLSKQVQNLANVLDEED